MRGLADVSGTTPPNGITNAPWHHPQPDQSDVHLDIVPEALLHALAAGETDATTRRTMTPYLTGPECASLWRRRSEQIRQRPGDAPWVTRLIVDPAVALPVGVAGFHGPPDAHGMVEVGYRVDPAHRRRGYARRALETLLAVAQEHPGVRTVRATVSPDNAASLALIAAYGFVENGEQWDEEDGREIVFEVSVDGQRRPTEDWNRTR
ncbi:GNAT family N-acetyltransferase [Curtobacterium herbarum]|nr:GNAT family N-acetyltransferase [Curtobacterium herbarum]